MSLITFKKLTVTVLFCDTSPNLKKKTFNSHKVTCVIITLLCSDLYISELVLCGYYQVMNQLRIKQFLICFLSRGIISPVLCFLWGPLQPSRNEPLQEDAYKTKQYGSAYGVNE